MKAKQSKAMKNFNREAQHITHRSSIKHSVVLPVTSVELNIKALLKSSLGSIYIFNQLNTLADLVLGTIAEAHN